MNVLKQIWKKWKRFWRVIGDWVGRGVMTVFYFTIAAPFGLGVRILSDPLRLKPGEPCWDQPEQKATPTLEDARRTF